MIHPHNPWGRAGKPGKKRKHTDKDEKKPPKGGSLFIQAFKRIETELLKETGQTIEELNTLNACTHFADELVAMIQGHESSESLNMTKGEYQSLKRYNLVESQRGKGPNGGWGSIVTEKAKRLLAEIGRLPR